jgi:hypothetical protein
LAFKYNSFYRQYFLFVNILLNINIILRTPKLGPTIKLVLIN